MHIRRFLPFIAVIACVLALVIPGCDELITEVNEITIAGHPTAEFEIDSNSADSGCAPLIVGFVDRSSGPHQHWFWDFGDGAVDTGDTNPVHTYTEAGTYTVKLTILDTTVDEDPGADTEVKNRFIIVGTTIDSFTASPTVGCQGMEVTFAPIKYGGISNFKWNFGDGSPLAGDSNPTHVYDSAGTFACTLTVTGACGTKVVGYDSMIVVNPCPLAQISVDTLFGCKPLAVEFQDDTDYRGKTRDSVFWRIERDSLLVDSSNADTFVDTFEVQGKYTAIMTVYSEGGMDVDTLDDTIMVWGPAFGQVSVTSPVEGCVDYPWLFYVDFKAVFDDSIDIASFDSLWWEFGDGHRSEPGDPMPIETRHPYDTAGRYRVTLWSWGKCAADTAIEDYEIGLVCVADHYDDSLVGFTIGPDADTVAAGIQGDTSVTFTFVDTTTVAGLDRFWDFGDGSLSETEDTVTHKYDTAGTFEVKLTRENCCKFTVAYDTVYVDTVDTPSGMRRYSNPAIKR